MFVKYVPSVPQIRNGMHIPLNQINQKVFEKNKDLCILENLRLDESYPFLKPRLRRTQYRSTDLLLPVGKNGIHITYVHLTGDNCAFSPFSSF